MDDEDVLEDEAMSDLEEEKSGSESSDDEEIEDEWAELDEFQQLNVDCTSADIIFVEDVGETMDNNELPRLADGANANEDMAPQDDDNEIEVR